MGRSCDASGDPPGDQLDEVLVEGDAGAGVEDGGAGVSVEVGGDHLTGSRVSVLSGPLLVPPPLVPAGTPWSSV